MEANIIQQYKRKAHFERGKYIPEQTLSIYYDSFPESPREWDNISHIIFFRCRHNIGDKHNYNSDDFPSWNDLEEYLRENEGAYIIHPLSFYDGRNGIVISIDESTERWDSERDYGVIYVTKQTIEYEYGKLTPETEELVEKVLRGEVKDYNQYFQGEVYGFVIKNVDGEIDYEEWGCYDDIDYIVKLTGFTEEDGVVNVY